MIMITVEVSKGREIIKVFGSFYDVGRSMASEDSFRGVQRCMYVAKFLSSNIKHVKRRQFKEFHLFHPTTYIALFCMYAVSRG